MEPIPQRSSSAQPSRGLIDTRLPLPGGLEVSFGQVTILAGIVFFALVVPGDFKYKMDGLGFAVCHQIHTHSFTIGGHQLPLCARCTGMYLGVLVTLLLLARLRRKAVRLPARGVLPVLGLFFGVMVLDGINSTLQTFGSGLWETTNLLRLITGALSGIAAAFIFYPVFNISLWNRDVTHKEHVIEQLFELAPYLIGTGLLVVLVLDGGSWLFYPLALLSMGGMLALLTMANTMVVLIVSRREGSIRTISEALTPILLGLLISLVLLSLVAWGRASLAPNMANSIGIPLVPGLP
jgi:uncharacterized membrane protein